MCCSASVVLKCSLQYREQYFIPGYWACQQKIILLSAAAVPKLQVSDAHPLEWNEGVGGSEESSSSGFLQHTQGKILDLPVILQEITACL